MRKHWPTRHRGCTESHLAQLSRSLCCAKLGLLVVWCVVVCRAALVNENNAANKHTAADSIAKAKANDKEVCGNLCQIF